MSAKVTVDLEKIRYNAELVNEKCRKSGIDIVAVSKVHGADPNIVKALLSAGINVIADSRIANLKKLQDFNCQKWLLRIPAPSECEECVHFADVSLNSEISTIMELDREAQKQGKIHSVILLFDLGDLREGFFYEDDILNAVGEVIRLKNINLLGIGTSLSCYGGILPTTENLGRLVEIKKHIEKKYRIKLKVVSGGSSTSYSLVRAGTIPEGINNLRIGDTIYIGRDDSTREHIEELYDDCFVLECEVIEVKEKPSVPIGVSGYASLNRKPVFEDRGIMKRAICSIGRQDIDLDLIPLTEGIKVLEASSDHLLLDVTHSAAEVRVGDKLRFKMQYAAIMRAFTSCYVEKEYKN